MPAASPRVKVTNTHGPFSVGDFAVCRSGGVVALHLGTPAGRFVFHVRELEFVKHARGARDHHGNAFRTLADLAEGGAEKAEGKSDPAAPAPARAPAPESPLARLRFIAPAHDEPGVADYHVPAPLARGVAPPIDPRFPAAWEFFQQNLHLTAEAVCAKLDLKLTSFRAWLNSRHPGELRALRRAAGLPLKPTSAAA